jgi:hypothetical protein
MKKTHKVNFDSFCCLGFQGPSTHLYISPEVKKWRGKFRENYSSLHMSAFFAIFSLPQLLPANQAMNSAGVCSLIGGGGGGRGGRTGSPEKIVVFREFVVPASPAPNEEPGSRAVSTSNARQAIMPQRVVFFIAVSSGKSVWMINPV